LTLLRAVLRGAVGFSIVSVAAFSIWAFGGKWFKSHGGEPAMDATIATAFVALSGLLLHPLAGGLARFYKVFVPAFLAYAAVWCAAWFALKFGWGEWLGSLAGSAAFALVSAALFRNFRPLPLALLALFVAHSAGYFLGGQLYYGLKSQHHTLAMLGWGAAYGLGFGAGIGAAFFALQKKEAT
jgi:hypothetical protein